MYLDAMKHKNKRLETRTLNIGDLVAVRRRESKVFIGMIVAFDDNYLSYTIEWYDPELNRLTNASWISAQEYRNIFLEYCKSLM